MDNGSLLLGPLIVAVAVVGAGIGLGLLGVIVYALDQAVGMCLDAVVARVRTSRSARDDRVELR